MSVIVIIDDCEGVLKYMTVKVADLNHIIHTFKNPLIAIEKVPDLHPDLVVCDYMMYDMVGMDVIDSLRAKGLDTKYILFTSLKDPELKKYCDEDDIRLVNKQEGLKGLLEEIKCLP